MKSKIQYLLVYDIANSKETTQVRVFKNYFNAKLEWQTLCDSSSFKNIRFEKFSETRSCSISDERGSLNEYAPVEDKEHGKILHEGKWNEATFEIG